MMLVSLLQEHRKTWIQDKSDATRELFQVVTLPHFSQGGGGGAFPGQLLLNTVPDMYLWVVEEGA